MASQNVFIQPVNKSQQLFVKINNFTCFTGLLNVWGDGVRVPAITTKSYYKVLYTVITLYLYELMLLEISAFFKRDKLNMKQIYDWIVIAFTHPIIYSFYLSVHSYKARLKDLIMCLTVELKNVYNNEKIERRMIKRVKVFVAAYFFLCSSTLALYGMNSLFQVINSDKTFTTVITVWPDTEDNGKIATFARIAYYIAWWVFMTRSSAAYILAIATTIGLSYQFQNVQAYFYGLDNIFRENDLSQLQKEEKYEKAVKVGIKLHSDTLWCCRQCEMIFNMVYSGQVVINLLALAVLMLQMVNSERTILLAVTIITTASTVLVTTGVFMWNAGDVTVEASKLATAMYSSGWENCGRASGRRVRNLLVVAMTQAQKPVIFRGCGIIELSYPAYLTIVKSSYSVFSLLY